MDSQQYVGIAFVHFDRLMSKPRKDTAARAKSAPLSFSISDEHALSMFEQTLTMPEQSCAIAVHFPRIIMTNKLYMYKKML